MLLRYSGNAYNFAKPWATVVEAAGPVVELWIDGGDGIPQRDGGGDDYCI